MGSDARYLVAIDFDVADISNKLSGLSSRVPPDLFGNATKNFKSEIGGIGSAVTAIGGRLSEAFTGAVEKAAELGMTLAKFGAIAAIGAATYGVVNLNSNLEKTRIALADILTANGVTSNLTDGLTQASGLMAKIRRDAAALPGETSDLAGIFKLASIPGLRAGADVNRIEKLSANAMAYGMGTVGLDGGTTSRELAMLLSGRAGAHNVLGANLGLIGGSAKKFNAESGAKQFAEIETLLAKHAGSIDLYANSFEGLSSTLKDNAKLVLSTATFPLFENAKKTLGEINGWFDAHRGTVIAWANHIGSRLSDAFDSAKSKIEEWWPAIQKFGHDAYAELAGIWTEIKPAIESVGASLKSALGDGTAIKDLKGVLEAYAALKIGSAAAPLLGSAISAFGPAMMGGGAAAAAGGAGLLVAPIGALTAAITLLAAGEAHALASRSSPYHTEAVKYAENLAHQSKTLANDFAPAVNGTMNAIDYLGVHATNLATCFVTGIDGIILFGYVLVQISDSKQDYYWEHGDHTVRYQHHDSDDHPDTGVMLPHGRSREGMLHGIVEASDVLKAVAPKIPNNMSQTVNNYVQMTISGSQEPSRIARVVTRSLAEMSRFPTSSRYAPASYLGGRRT